MQSFRQIVTTNIPTPSFLQAGCPSCCPTINDTELRVNNVEAIIIIIMMIVRHAV